MNTLINAPTKTGHSVITPLPIRSASDRVRGATLLVGMILLILLSASALTAFKAVKTDERLSGNLQDSYLAFQAAEAALREAEELLAQPSLPSLGAAQGLYRFDANDIPKPFDFSTSNARRYGRDLSGVAQRPLYILERMESTSAPGESLVPNAYGGQLLSTPYRITAIGFGGSALTRVVLQTTYLRN